MQAGKSNRADWVKRLDGLASTSLDKETAWEKLNKKLPGNKKTSRRQWWPAIPVAAALILFFLLNNKSSKPVKVQNVAPQPVVTIPAPSSPKNLPITAEAIKRNPVTSSTVKVMPVKTTLPVLQPATVDSTSITIVTNTPDTVSPVVVKSPPSVVFKKKPTVVHINELQAHTPAMQPETAKSGTPLFKNKLKQYNPTNEINTEANPEKVTSKKSILPFIGLSQKE